VTDRKGDALVLLAAVLAAWATSFGGTFQFDDWNVIVNEPRVASLAAWWGSMPGIRPLLKLSWAANQASGLGLAGFHAVNLAFHATAALLALQLLRRLAERTGASDAGARWGPLLGALLFALHPLQTEAVTYVSGRSASMAGALALASAVAWISGREGAGGWRSGVLSPLLFAGALATKESVVVLPAALLLLEAVDLRRPFRWGAALRGIWPHLAVLAIAAALFAASPVYGRMMARSAALRSPWVNLLTHVDAVSWLAGQVLRIDRLVADPALPAVEVPGARVVLEGAALLAAVIFGLAWLRRRPAVAFGLLWFLLWLPPAGWWLPRPEPASERQLYLSVLGPAWVAGLWLSPWVAAGGARRAAVAALIVALGGVTAVRSLIYADEVRFWEDVVAKAPANPRAHANLGFALAARCRTQDAEASLERALALDPAYLRAAVNLRLLREGAPLGPAEPACPAVTPRRPPP
jgi:tetratricopeptide (TPR) repeat protein